MIDPIRIHERHRLQHSLLALALILFTGTSAHAIENCKAKIDQRDGTILVFGKNVGANPRWGFLPGEETEEFSNEAECIKNERAKKCALDNEGTAARITPPDLCTLYIADDSSTDCAAYVKGCVPGARSASGGGCDGLFLDDATGRELGRFVGFASGDPPRFDIFVPGHQCVFTWAIDATPGTTVNGVQFSGADCTGDAYVYGTSREVQAQRCFVLLGGDDEARVFIYAGTDLSSFPEGAAHIPQFDEDCTTDPPQGQFNTRPVTEITSEFFLNPEGPLRIRSGCQEE